jgi:Fic family protein
MVIEHGITVAGKPLKDHLEAIDHFDAIPYVRQLARHNAPLTGLDVRNLHGLAMQRSQPGHRWPLRRSRPLRPDG